MVKSIVPPGSGAARLHATGSGRGGGHPDTRTDPELPTGPGRPGSSSGSWDADDEG